MRGGTAPDVRLLVAVAAALQLFPVFGCLWGNIQPDGSCRCTGATDTLLSTFCTTAPLRPAPQLPPDTAACSHTHTGLHRHGRRM